MENRELTYTQFWQDNLEKIALIQKDLDRSLNELEKQYVCFDEVYRDLEEDLDLLSSLYAGLNTIEGMEYVQKLRAMISQYRSLYTREGIDFETLNFLTLKIQELREISFEDFPVLDHRDDEKEEIAPLKESTDYEDRPFKWISFQRNGSWFLSFFNRLKIIDAEVTSFTLIPETNRVTVSADGVPGEGIDMFGEFAAPRNDPEYFIVIDDIHLWAADGLGKRIYAAHDIVTGKVTPLARSGGSSLVTGRARLFGRQHLYISHR